MINAAIIGANGYTGYELMRILSGHTDVKLKTVTSRTYLNKTVNEVFKGLNLDLKFSEPSDIKDCDVIFSALPPTASAQIVGEFADKGTRIIDLSADYRFFNLDTYQSVYKSIHPRADLIPQSVYGLCEVYRKQIKSAKIIANPGCYVTSALLPLIPLIQNNCVEKDNIIIDAKSGVSGAGRKSEVEYSFCELDSDFKAYSPIVHRHSYEIAEKLNIQNITFCPHLLPVKRGILSTIYAKCNDYSKVQNTLKEFYKDSRFVSISDTLPSLKQVTGTNNCKIATTYDQKTRQLIIVSVLDNLLKGASGQAVQNMNIMFGIEEDAGLKFLPMI